MMMRKRKILTWSLIVAIPVCAAGFFLLQKRSASSESRQAVMDFVLLDQSGVIHQLSHYSDAKAVVLMAYSHACEGETQALHALESARAAYESRGFVFLLIDADKRDTREALIEAAKSEDMPPILIDSAQIVSRQLGLSQNSELAIVDPRQNKKLYLGGFAPEVLETVATGLSPQKRLTVQSCEIPYWRTPDLSYSSAVAPLLKQKCLNCHHSKSHFPPFFDSYQKVAPWAEMIRETLYTDRMPPFSADPMYGHYLNDISLTPEEKRMLVDWVEAGAKKDPGERDPLLHFHGQRGRRPLFDKTPIYSAEMAVPAKIPPQGDVEYKYFQLGGRIPRDLWIHAMNVTSTNPRQLHHEALMITPKPLSYYEERSHRNEALVRANKNGDVPEWTLWTIFEVENGKDMNFVRTQVWGLGKKQPIIYRRKAALYLPKGYYLILESHYMGTGKPDEEKTKIDFFGETKSHGRTPVSTVLVHTDKIDIPPGAKRFVVTTPPKKFDHDVEILAFLGHMHMRGRSVKAVQTLPDGSSRTIMSIPNFYYGWQTGTGLIPDPPVRIVAGSKITVYCEYDNSAQNPNNPDPTETVHFGQTHDKAEMCKVNLQVRKLKE